MTPPGPRNFVYVIGTLEGCHKIGFSIDPDGRAAALSKRGFPLCVVHRIATREPQWLEATLHAAFDRVRVGGEWFRLSASDIALLASLAEVHDAAALPESIRRHAGAGRSNRPLPAFAPKRMRPGHTHFFVELPIELAAEVRAFAKSRGETIADVSRLALRRHMQTPPPPPVVAPPPVVPTLPQYVPEDAGEAAPAAPGKPVRSSAKAKPGESPPAKRKRKEKGE